MERAALVCIHGFRKLIGDYLRHLDLLQFSLHLLHYIFSYLQKKKGKEKEKENSSIYNHSMSAGNMKISGSIYITDM